MLNDHKCFCDILGSDWNKNMTFCRSLQQCRIKMTDTKQWWFDLGKGQKRIIIQCISMFPSWQTFSFDRHWNQIEKEIDFIVKFTRSLICLFVIHGLTSCFFQLDQTPKKQFYILLWYSASSVLVCCKTESYSRLYQIVHGRQNSDNLTQENKNGIYA